MDAIEIVLFLPSPHLRSNQFFTNIFLTRRAIISLKKINSIEEETMKAITKQLSINQLKSSGKFCLLLTSFNASSPYLFLNDRDIDSSFGLSSLLPSVVHLHCLPKREMHVQLIKLLCISFINICVFDNETREVEGKTTKFSQFREENYRKLYPFIEFNEILRFEI